MTWMGKKSPATQPQKDACHYARLVAVEEWPPNSTMLERSQRCGMLLAAAIAIRADTTPPPYLTFNRYCWSFPSRCLQRRSGITHFFEGSTHTSLSSRFALVTPFSSLYAFLMEHREDAWTGWPSFFFKCVAAVVPWTHAYLPMFAWILVKYLQECTNFSVTCNSFFISPFLYWSRFFVPPFSLMAFSPFLFARAIAC